MMYTAFNNCVAIAELLLQKNAFIDSKKKVFELKVVVNWYEEFCATHTAALTHTPIKFSSQEQEFAAIHCTIIMLAFLMTIADR